MNTIGLMIGARSYTSPPLCGPPPVPSRSSNKARSFFELEGGREGGREGGEE